MKACDIPKLHQEDPSGFWKLIRTGADLPTVGQQILYVYDIRGTSAEHRHELLFNIAKGDPYRITNDAPPSKLPAGVAGLHAELFKLPTYKAGPETHVGVVQDVCFDEVLQEHYITIGSRNNVWSKNHASEHVIYWAPFPAPADTYTPRTDDFDLYYVNGIISKEQEIVDARISAEYNAKHGE